MLGGRTNHWGRISLRFGPDDFQHKTIDGLGENWPITYDDIKPYYDQLDELVGIFGSKEGIHNEPDGIFLPPPKPRCYEMLIKQASDKLGIPVYSLAPVDSHQVDPRPSAVPLLRAVRTRLRDALEFLVDVGLPAAGAGHRQADDRHRAPWRVKC
jgi:choline dehydrogenase-like flavoprotein